ncbi:hypothetical protein EMIT0P291_130109 [Pseudomonas sp. IT-P291]
MRSIRKTFLRDLFEWTQLQGQGRYAPQQGQAPSPQGL